jgi:ketosteroid isomerase-like protein
MSLTADDERALRALAAGYARAVDRRDAGGFVAVFTPDGVLKVREPGAEEPRSVLRGSAELARVTDSIASYDATFHFLGQATYAEEGDGASGEVYCTARHLTRTRHGATEYTMLIRYQDRYARVAGGWRIAERDLIVDWTGLQLAVPPRQPK